ncbi:MAG: hypothetical protein RMJ88_11495 [Thermogemmata sp.]|nr:hypothetical protein [Thermogemmata sp.]
MAAVTLASSEVTGRQPEVADLSEAFDAFPDDVLAGSADECVSALILLLSGMARGEVGVPDEADLVGPTEPPQPVSAINTTSSQAENREGQAEGVRPGAGQLPLCRQRRVCQTIGPYIRSSWLVDHIRASPQR